MHIVAAHVRHRDRIALSIGGRRLAGIGKAGRFLDRQCVHVGAQHDGRAVAVPKQADHAGLADARRYFIAGRTKTVRSEFGRPRLLHRQLGV